MQERTQIKFYQDQIYYLIPHLTIRLCTLHAKLGIPIITEQLYELFNCWNYMCRVFLKYLKLCEKFQIYPFPRGSMAVSAQTSSSKDHGGWEWLSKDDPDIVLPNIEGLNMDYCIRDTIIQLTHYLADKVIENPEEAHKYFDTLINTFEKECIDEVVLIEIVRAARKIIMSNIKIVVKMDSTQGVTYHSSQGNRSKLIGRLQERMPNGFDLASNELLELTYDYLKNVTEVKDHHKKILNYTLLQLRNKSLKIRSKFFSLFDQYYGRSVYKRLEHIFLQQIWDYSKDSKDSFWIQQDLDLLLSSVDEDAPMQREPGGVVLLAFRGKKNADGQMVDVLPQELQRIVGENERIVKELKTKKTGYWLRPLKDVTNWEHHICEKLWLKLFPQFWNVMTADEQQQIASLIEPFLTREEFLKQMQGKRPNAIKVMFEAISACDPLPKLAPEVIQFLGKNYIAWHTALPLLESYLHAYPGNERYYVSMSIILKHLAETDYVLGLQRHVSKSPVTHAALSLAQFQLWNPVDDLLSVEIVRNFNALHEKADGGVPAGRDLATLLDQIDFRIWEEWESEAALNLNKWEMLKTLGLNTNKTSFILQCYWSTHDWTNFIDTSKKLGNSEIPLSLLVQLYERLQQPAAENDSDRDTIYKRGLKAFYTEWNMLPNIVDAPHYQSIIIQEHFLETNEYKNMQKDLKESMLKETEPDIKSYLSPWRERLPNKCEPFNVWRDLLECRNFLFSQLKAKLSTNPAFARFEQNIHDIPWNYLKLAEVARKHGMIDQAFQYLNEADKNIKETGDVHNHERFLRAKETAKLSMLFDTEWEGAAEYLKKVERQSYCKKSNVALSEIMRLRGELLNKMGKSRDAYEELSSAPSECVHNYKAWLAYAMFCEAQYEAKKEAESNALALKGYMQAAIYMLSKSKYYIPRVLLCLERNPRPAENAENSTMRWFKELIVNLPTWVWLYWIPQLVSNLERSDAEREAALMVLTNITKLHPQGLFIYIKRVQEKSRAPEASKRLVSDLALLRKSLCREEREGRILNSIWNMLNELESKVLINPSREDEFLFHLKQIYNKCIPIVPVKEFLILAAEVGKKFFESNDYPILQTHYREKFGNDFLSKEAENASITELMHKLRNWIDYLYTKVTLRAEHHSIDGYSQELASYMPGRVEMFGVGQQKDAEPLPETTVYIAKLETKVEKNFHRTRVDFRGTNERNYNYYLTNFNGNDINEVFMTQLRIYLNKIFASNRHTMARNVRLHSPFSLYWGRMKMTLDEQHIMSLSDLHDAALIERGLHPEHASICYLQKAQHGEDSASATVVGEMRYLLGDYVLAGFIHKLVSNPDELFIYKKQFTSYLAAQSFFTFAFKVDPVELSSLLFCKRTGKVNFASYQQNFAGVDNGARASAVPFRLTPNLQYFCTPIGIQGPFAGAVTAAAYALQGKKLAYFKGYLRSYYRNVLEEYGKESLEGNIERNIERTLETIGGLLDLTQVEKPFRARYMRPRDGDAPMQEAELEQEGVVCFNQAVYKRIEEAQDAENLKKMPLIWAPWF